MRTWTEGVLVYGGFNKKFQEPIPAPLIGVVIVDGEIDVFALDEVNQFEEYVKYQVDNGFWGHVVLLGMYRRDVDWRKVG